MRKTLAGCHALLGEDARPSNGPVDVVVDGHYIAAPLAFHRKAKATVAAWKEKLSYA